MFLSQLVVNVRSPLVRRDLASGYELHRTLLNGGFAGVARTDVGRMLFRVDADRTGGNPVLLVQSEAEPDWASLPADYLRVPARSKRFEPTVSAGRRLRFRLRANPTKRVAAKNERLGGVMLGRRVGLTTEEDRVAWLLRKGEAGGFVVPGAWVPVPDPVPGRPTRFPNFRVDVIPEGRDRNGKAAHGDGAFVAVRFEGVLEVTDPAAFVATVRAGVGSAKGFGFGLLSVAPA